MAECAIQADALLNANAVLVLVPFTCPNTGAGEVLKLYPLEAQTDGSFSFSLATADANNKNTGFQTFVPTRKSATVAVGFNKLPDSAAPVQRAFEDRVLKAKKMPVQVMLGEDNLPIFGKGWITDYNLPSSTDAGPVNATATLTLDGAFGTDASFAGF